MIKNKGFWTVKIFIVLAMFIASYYFYDIMPAQVPTSWGLDGQIQDTASKSIGLFAIPVLCLFMLIGFPITRKLDPRSKKYDQFESTWEIIQVAIISFFAYFHGVLIYVVLNDVGPGKFIILGIGALFIILGNYFAKIRHNYFVGIKTPWTIDSQKVWNKTHRMARWIWVIAGLYLIGLVVSGLFDKFEYRGYLVFIPIIVSVGVPFVYSYLIYEKDDTK